jgi:uncharacterized protein
MSLEGRKPLPFKERCMAIIDRRKSGKNKSVDNRKRLIDRLKPAIKQKIDESLGEGSITDATEGKKIKIPKRNLQEPSFEFDHKKGKGKRVLTGNKEMNKGDKIDSGKSGEGESGTGGSDSGEGEDEFEFTLSKAEFLELMFSDMALPDFVKESMKDTIQYKLQRSGYAKEGTPPRLALVRTLKQALARRIATGSERFIDDVDLRYKHFVRKPLPIRHAVIFMMMDVSGSMGMEEKLLAKKFFLLFYLFLEKEYKKVDIIFIRHTQEAKEVGEHEFFYGRETGGTIVSSGLNLINEIIEDRIDSSTSNVYVAQASDGDNFESDGECVGALEKLLDKIQYLAYVQTEDRRRRETKAKYNMKDLWDTYDKVDSKKLNKGRLMSPSDVYPVLRNLFKKEK